MVSCNVIVRCHSSDVVCGGAEQRLYSIAKCSAAYMQTHTHSGTTTTYTAGYAVGCIIMIISLIEHEGIQFYC